MLKPLVDWWKEVWVVVLGNRCCAAQVAGLLSDTVLCCSAAGTASTASAGAAVRASADIARRLSCCSGWRAQRIHKAKRDTGRQGGHAAASRGGHYDLRR